MLLMDIDAAVKLAHWNLLDELPALINKEWNELSTISSLRHRARRSREHPDGKLFRTTKAAETVLAAMERMVELPNPDKACLATFQDNTEIDPGEAVLLSTIYTSIEIKLLTGDKRALRALARLDQEIKHSFCGRILVIEQLVLKALNTHGLDWLRERVCQDMHADTAIATCMGSHCNASKESVVCGLDSYINEIVTLNDPSLLATL